MKDTLSILYEEWLKSEGLPDVEPYDLLNIDVLNAPQRAWLWNHIYLATEEAGE